MTKCCVKKISFYHFFNFSAKIGLLSVTEFTVTTVVSSFVLLSLVGVGGWFMYQKVISTSESISADE